MRRNTSGDLSPFPSEFESWQQDRLHRYMMMTRERAEDYFDTIARAARGVAGATFSVDEESSTDEEQAAATARRVRASRRSDRLFVVCHEIKDEAGRLPLQKHPQLTAPALDLCWKIEEWAEEVLSAIGFVRMIATNAYFAGSGFLDANPRASDPAFTAALLERGEQLILRYRRFLEVQEGLETWEKFRKRKLDAKARKVDPPPVRPSKADRAQIKIAANIQALVLKQQHPTMSDRQIAEIIGWSHTKLHRDPMYQALKKQIPKV